MQNKQLKKNTNFTYVAVRITKGGESICKFFKEYFDKSTFKDKLFSKVNIYR